MAVDGKGYLFTANCGTGKSTHTRYWRETFGTRAVMVNDDKPFLRIMENQVLVCGAPWSGKHGLDTNVTVPLAGICILERGGENRIAPLSPSHALAMLEKQSAAPETEDLLPHFHRLISRLSTLVPLWQMTCTKDPQAAQAAYNAMSAER